MAWSQYSHITKSRTTSREGGGSQDTGEEPQAKNGRHVIGKRGGDLNNDEKEQCGHVDWVATDGREFLERGENLLK